MDAMILFKLISAFLAVNMLHIVHIFYFNDLSTTYGINVLYYRQQFTHSIEESHTTAILKRVIFGKRSLN